MQTNPKLMTEDGLINCLETVLNSYLIDYSYKIHLMAEDNQDKFWSVTSQEYEVKEVEFCLLAPNLFDCNDSASDLSREMHKKMNAEKTTIKLVSDTGLILQEDNIGSYVDYTSRGAGYWKIKSFNKRANSTVKVSSKDARKKMKIILEYTGGRLESVETSIIKEKFEDDNE